MFLLPEFILSNKVLLYLCLFLMPTKLQQLNILPLIYKQLIILPLYAKTHISTSDTRNLQ